MTHLVVRGVRVAPRKSGQTHSLSPYQLQFLFVYLHFIGGVCFVIIGFSSLLLLVTQEGCASSLWHFVVITLIFNVWILYMYIDRGGGGGAVADNTRGQNSYLTCRLVDPL